MQINNNCEIYNGDCLVLNLLKIILKFLKKELKKLLVNSDY